MPTSAKTPDQRSDRYLGASKWPPKPWEVDGELWVVIEPLLPKVERRARHPGRKRHPDWPVFQDMPVQDGSFKGRVVRDPGTPQP